MAYEALDSLQQTLTEILKLGDDLTTHRVKQDIISIHVKAIVLQFNLKAFPEKETIRKVASTAHEIIEYLFSPEILSHCGSIDPSVIVSKHLRELAEELDLIVGDLVDYCSVNARQSNYFVLSSLSHRLERLAEKILRRRRYIADYSVSKVRRVNDSARSAPTSNDVAVGTDEDLSYSAADTVPTIKDGVVVGFEEDLMKMVDRLIHGPPYLDILPIVGMGGIGKTTLAQIVYNHPRIMENFDIRAWVTISQDHSVENTFSNLLANMKGKGKRIQAQGDSYKAEEIYKHLLGRRYLIVLDDIWSTKVWDDIRMLFPNNYCGSQILLTTRLWDVAATIAGSSSYIHMMRFLDDQQSWHLFQRKVFADQTSCPLELQSVAKKIVTSCGGLPLSIVTVAEHLSNIDRTPRLWEQIVASNGDGQLESILSSSYNHLPHYLKVSFLYMAGFPKDYEIRVSELIKLWIAEGFLEGPYESKTLEEMAEEDLEVLVEKSLVLVTSRKIDGKIKSCRLHNLVRDFCVRQAGQNNFLLPVMDYLPTPILRWHFLPQLLKNHPRISATWYDLDLKDSWHSSYTHSIICIPQSGYMPKGSVRNFRSLRVLHVLRRDDHLYWELGQVFHLIHLKYLASNIPSSIVPPAISKVHNLQTLIIYRYGVLLPVEIWRMRQLRHLIAFSFNHVPHPEAAALPSENLRTLSIASNFVCSERMVEMIPNIKKLGICYSREEFDKDYHLENLERFDHLEKLKLEMCSDFPFGPSLNPVFPKSLRKLSLSGWRHPWEDLSIIGSLPNLQVLKLRNYACDGSNWETAEETFEHLEFLLIDESNLQEWWTESSHFPKLKWLVLHRCLCLSEIPDDIGYIPTLELIEVKCCNQSLVDSAKKIQKDQEMEGNYSIQVRYSNAALSSSTDHQSLDELADQILD